MKSIYESIIRELLRERDPTLVEPESKTVSDIVRCVEGYLRLEHGCLDSLSREDFREAIPNILEAIDLDVEGAIELADSYGL